MSISRKLRTEVNYLFFRKYRNNRVVRRHLLDAYTTSSDRPEDVKPMVVMKFDGKVTHCGLADRLRAAATFYAAARERGMEFRIDFTSPCPLERFLVPAGYDWRLREGEISYNAEVARPFFLDTCGWRDDREQSYIEGRIAEMLGPDQPPQRHVYANVVLDRVDFGSEFRELFRPSEELQELLSPVLSKLGDDFIGIATRFGGVLGDFDEPMAHEVLSEEASRILLDECFEAITSLTDGGKVKALVTTDSPRFLEEVKALPGVCVVDGRVAHIDQKSDDMEAHIKTFMDFLLLGHGRKVYQLWRPPMYAGNFSKRAAEATGAEYELIKLPL